MLLGLWKFLYVFFFWNVPIMFFFTFWLIRRSLPAGTLQSRVGSMTHTPQKPVMHVLTAGEANNFWRIRIKQDHHRNPNLLQTKLCCTFTEVEAEGQFSQLIWPMFTPTNSTHWNWIWNPCLRKPLKAGTLGRQHCGYDASKIHYTDRQVETIYLLRSVLTIGSKLHRRLQLSFQYPHPCVPPTWSLLRTRKGPCKHLVPTSYGATCQTWHHLTW